MRFGNFLDTMEWSMAKVPRNSISVAWSIRELWTCWVTGGSLEAHYSYTLSHLLASTYNSTLGTRPFGLGLEFFYNFPWKVLLLNGCQLLILCCEGEEPDCFEKERKPGDSNWSSVSEGWKWDWERLRAKKNEGTCLVPPHLTKGSFPVLVHWKIVFIHTHTKLMLSMK